ncbi:MAG: cell division/cell wall cluster transcriptional repressor MraZ [Synergistaceae bacterium]|jgi:MraZ protein|nr:cell division/cell wall cluster transcriptional repressor MraZ [Synergistaceae bacterium]
MKAIGGFDHKLDPKGRIVLPSCFREALGDRVVAAVIDGQCISVYSESSWEDVIARLNEISMQSSKGDAIQRRILAYSFMLEIDSMGRILIPEKLRATVGIIQNVRVNGKDKKLEIWDRSLWEKFMSETESLASDVRELVPGL